MDEGLGIDLEPEYLTSLGLHRIWIGPSFLDWVIWASLLFD